jgi:hypothetical protein
MLDRLQGIATMLRKRGLRSPEAMLLLMGAASYLAFSTWTALINNFSVERAAFTGAEIGTLQSLREVPGFLAFTAVFLLLFVKEQRFALLSLALLGIGTAVTGYFPTVVGLYITTVLMSIGYHYNETVQQSLALQWIEKERTPLVLGRVRAAASAAALLCYGMIYVSFEMLDADFTSVYLVGGGAAALVALFCWFYYPITPTKVEQHKKLIFRQRYWLYYGLTFLAGARRQIFVVFAGFMMVEKFGYSVANITLLLLVNYAVNIWLAPKIGSLIQRIGERRALTLEYVGLIGVFTSYAFVESATLAAGLYIADHLFFSMAIAIKTYFQKIADPRDIAPTAAVSFTINHIAAVVLPVLLGLIWLASPAAVFLTGTAFAVLSLILSQLIPHDPEPGRETMLVRPAPQPAE